MPAKFFRTVTPLVLSQRSKVTQMLREAIISGDLKPGTQLKQSDISKKFKCSPGPVREAMRDLESEGLIEHFQNRGVFVTSITKKEFLEMLLPTRVVLEKFALKNSLQKFTPEVISALKKQIAIMHQGAKNNDIQVVNKADINFHIITMEAVASQQTLQLWKSVLSRIRLEFYSFGPHPSILNQAKNHETLLKAFINGDSVKVEEALEWHSLSPHA